jgi:hypothetical protein
MEILLIRPHNISMYSVFDYSVSEEQSDADIIQTTYANVVVKNSAGQCDLKFLHMKR